MLPTAADAEETAYIERRTSVRYFSNLACRLVADDPANSRPAIIRDISRGGLGLILNQPFERDSMVAVEVPLPDLGRLRVLIARVVHSSPNTEGQWHVGCAFITVLQQAELEVLLGPCCNHKSGQS
jgi:hypothetical protein